MRIVRDASGLTLVELMIVLVLSLVLMSAVYTTFQVQKGTSDVQHEVVALQQDIRAVMDMMARDIRLAGCDPTMQSGAGLVEAQTGPLKMSMTMDMNEDGVIAGTDEQVSYTYAGTTLSRNGVVLADNVVDFGLVYRDANNAAVAPTGAGNTSFEVGQSGTVRYVEVSMTLQSRKKDQDINDYIRRDMTRTIRLRNMGI